MKKIIFTLFSLVALQFTFGQTTYYYVGGTAPTLSSFNTSSYWNTVPGGGGTPRTTAAASDVLIFDGSDVSSDPGIQTGPVSWAITSPTAGTGPAQLKLINNADVSLSRFGSGGTTTLTIGGSTPIDNDPDFVVQQGSKFIIGGTTGSFVTVLSTTATGEVYGNIIFGDNGNGTTNQNRLVSLVKGALQFMQGSTATTTTNYGYNPFGTSGSTATPAAASGVVFRSGSTFTYGGGLSPFGTSANSLLDFQPGSTVIFTKAPTGVSSIWSNRVYPNVIIQNNTTINPDATFIKMDTVTIQSGSGFLMNTSGSTPINGNIINNGTFAAPAADPNRGNRLLMIGSSSQTISGTGTYNVGNFVISNASNVSLQKTLTVDSSTIIFGTLSPNGNLAGAGTTVARTAQTYNVTGNTNVDSFIVKNISSFSGIEAGMSVSGTNIHANTVVVTFSSVNGTITLSKPVTGLVTYASAATNLTVFNGNGVLPIKFGDVSATFQNQQTRVMWKVFTEDGVSKYIVERSINGAQFNDVATVPASGKSQYNWVDFNPMAGSNYYRVKAISNDGDIKYSIILKVNNSKSIAEFLVYPNPVKGKTMSIQLNNLDKGNYTISLYNSLGQKAFTTVIAHPGGSVNQTITLPSIVIPGMYKMKAVGTAISLQQTLIVE